MACKMHLSVKDNMIHSQYYLSQWHVANYRLKYQRHSNQSPKCGLSDSLF
jgi:hypothetical protein